VQTPVCMEPILKYHPGMFEVLTQVPYRDRGHCVVGSLTGAVSSQRVTEEHEGALSMVGNHAKSVKAKARLTARQTRRAGTKVGLSDPVVLYGRAIAQRIKGTPGITG
jgi:sugar diacid utilization regulator